MKPAMTPTPPSILILHGNDEFSMLRYCARDLMEQVFAPGSDPAMNDLNTTRLDGRSSSLDDLRMAANSMPFLAERRLVIVAHPLTGLEGESNKTKRERFVQFLDELPPTTTLALLIEDQGKNRKFNGQWTFVWEALHGSHWLRKWLKQQPERARMVEFLLPRKGELAAWIQREAAAQGGKFAPDAAQALAACVGDDTRLASREIEKLLTYADRARPVSAADVDLLTASTGQSDVFQLVDAMAQGSRGSAQHMLHELLRQEDPERVFPMVVRQFRLLLQAREVMEEGGGLDEFEQETATNHFVADKVFAQARRFSFEQLKDIYRWLLRMDEAQKTSRMDYDLSLDLLIPEL